MARPDRDDARIVPTGGSRRGTTIYCSRYWSAILRSHNVNTNQKRSHTSTHSPLGSCKCERRPYGFYIFVLKNEEAKKVHNPLSDFTNLHQFVKTLNFVLALFGSLADTNIPVNHYSSVTKHLLLPFLPSCRSGRVLYVDAHLYTNAWHPIYPDPPASTLATWD